MIRVGLVRYRNTLPLAVGLEERLEVSLHPGDPSAVARDLAAGRLDVGLVPVAALATHPEWPVVRGLGIASCGPVASVLLLSRKPLAEAQRLVIDPASRTSNILAQLWLRRSLHRKIEVVDGGQDLENRLEGRAHCCHRRRGALLERRGRRAGGPG